MVTLATLGWTSERESEFAPFRAAGLDPGRVCLEHNHVLRVMTAEGEELAEAAGRLKHQAGSRKELPAVGDWVALKPDESGNRRVIHAVLSRRSVFSRKAAGRETEEQIVAANIDTVLVVFGLDQGVNLRAIERYLVVARRSGAQPLVILNKADVADDLAAAVAEAVVVAGDTPVHAVSTREPRGVAVLDQYLREGETMALLGPSGAGKSSIVNRLIGGETLATGEVRDWDARGRHTSVHRQLVVRANGGLIIDTPGMREVALWDTDAVGDSFADIAEIGERCRFRDCQHDREPGCAVKQAVEAGTLDAGRYQSFVKLQEEQSAVERRRDERALLEEKRKSKVMGRAIRAMKNDRARQGR